MTAETFIFIAKILAAGLLFLGFCFISHRIISKNKTLYFPTQSYAVGQMIGFAAWFMVSSPAIEQYFGEPNWWQPILYNILLLTPFLIIEARFLKKYKLPADRNAASS